MSRKLMLTALIVLCTFVCFLAPSWAVDTKDVTDVKQVKESQYSKETADTQKEQQKMAEEYMKMMAPGESHAYLKGLEGSWDVKTTAWMTPGQEPVVTQSLSEGSMLMGGRFLMLRFAGTMFGQPFEGLQIVGYDNLKKKYVTFWIDNQSTGFYLTEGTRDSTTGAMTETGNWPDPMTGGTIGIRGVTTPVSKDEYTYELFMTPAGGKEFKTLENRMTRKKKAE